MKVQFNLTDETTITNTTVKVTIWITAAIGEHTRDALDGIFLKAAKEFIPDTKWAFSNFTYQPDGLTARVMATTRIDVSLNDQLDQKSARFSNNSREVKIAIHNIDPSIPLHDIRTAEGELRKRMLELAAEQASALGMKVSKIVFEEPYGTGVANVKAMGFNATYAQESPAGGGAKLGHSEKRAMSATVTAINGE